MTLNQVFNCNTTEQALELLERYNKDAKIIAGGTDIIIALRNKKISPKVLIDIAKLEDLKKIYTEDNKIFIGAAATYTQIVESELFKDNLYGLYKACRLVGSPQIRNKGTIGGNIANASPAADSIPPLIALGAKVNMMSTRGVRKVVLEDYFRDIDAHGVKEDELILNIEFEKPKDNEILSFSKLGLRKALAISRITLSTLIETDDTQRICKIKATSGSIGKYPMRELDLEKALLGKTLDLDIIEVGINVLKSSMDQRLQGRSTLPYKRRAVESILEEALKESISYYLEVRI